MMKDLKSCQHANDLLTNPMELSSSWEAASFEATQELPSILCNPKDHNRIHKSSPLVPALSQTNPVYITQSYLSRIILILSTNLLVSPHSGLRPFGFPTNNLYAFFFVSSSSFSTFPSVRVSCYMPCPSYRP
jgi:hypothetical protein